MHPRDDLSTRTDFSYDLMQKVSAEARSAIEGSDALREIQDRADFKVEVTGTLRNVLINVKIVPKEGVAIPEDELAEVRKKVGEALDGALKDRLGDLLQEAVDSARGRM